MSIQEDISSAHWRTVGTIVIAILVTTGVLGIGVSIGHTLTLGGAS